MSVVATPGPRPRDDELDLFGLTHPGKVRKENQDHFLLCTVHQQIVVHGTSLPAPESLPLRGQRLATIMLVADGVGGSNAGGEASRLATEAVTSYVASTMDCFHASGTEDEPVFLDALHRAATEAHAAVKGEAERTGARKMATTLTLAIAVWPRLYVVQVGDSRCYHYQDGGLHQITRDQTVAQDLVDAGVLPAERAAGSPFQHVLARAIGSGEATPDVTVVDITQRGCLVVLCSDGLTKHVTNEEMAAVFESMESSEQAARTLLDKALAGGGTDNITIIVARARKVT